MRVEVQAPSHVHVGNVDIEGGMGRLYGTLGFTLRWPRLRMFAEEREGLLVEAPASVKRVVEGYARLFSEAYGVGARIVVEETIPRGIGLGATTAIALSVGAALATLAGRRWTPEELAVKAGRARVSGLGLYAFKHGGFLVDGGFVPGRPAPPPLIFRALVPSSISVVVAVPDTPVLDEILALKEREDEVLESMPPMSSEMACANARRVLMGVLPAAAEGDWATAGRYLYALNSGLGDYWEARQRGRYCCREAEEAVRIFMESGAYCACQSSWGPTVYGLVPSDRAEEARSALASRITGATWITSVSNEGAVLRVRRS